jgi:Zn-dependent protease with chaperone function
VHCGKSASPWESILPVETRAEGSHIIERRTRGARTADRLSSPLRESPIYFARTTMRILLFPATNAAILVLISVVFQIFGFEGILQENGVDLDLKALLLLSAIIGFGGSFISLAMSKWMAKRAMGVQIIEQPANQSEQWLVETVRRRCHLLRARFLCLERVLRA